MNKRMSTLAAGLLSIALLLPACAGGSEVLAPEATAIAQPSPEPTPTATPEPLTFAAPLTGIQLEQQSAARPIAVMINNLAPARPQSGLTNADIVWEVLAEGGITRLVAVFQSTDAATATIGPIRSIRPYLIELGESYGAVLAHAGGSMDAYAILQQQGKPYLDEISNGGGFFWRSKERKAPHNLYSSLEQLRAGAEKRAYKLDTVIPAYSFTETGADDPGEPASSISLTFQLKSYKVGYEYDSATGLYKRSINDKPHLDMNNDEQLSAANLVVLSTGHKTLDNEGRLAVNLEDGGPALLFQKGKVVQAEWVHAADGMIRLSQAGKELPFVPGKTYFHIVPNNTALESHVTWVQ
jgi:hypothetical protein